MIWQFFAFAQVLISSSDALLQRSLAKVKNVSAQTKATFAHIGVVAVGVAYAIFAGDFTFDFDNIGYFYATSAALLIAIGSVAIFKAAETLDAANLNIIIMLRAVGVTLVAAVLLGETLSVGQLIGAALIMLAGYIASHPDRGEKMRHSKGVFAALLGVVFFSVGLVLEKASVDTMGAGTYFLVGWTLQLVFVAVLSAKHIRNDGKKNIAKLSPRMALLGLLTGLGGLTYILALSHADNVPLVVSFLNLKVILIIIGGYIFLKERRGMHHKIAGGALALAGVILLTVRL